jgi:hypothetical protein
MIGAQKALGLARSFEVDDVLGVVGLERRRSTLDRLLPALGIFGAGAAAGAACALLMAPSSGAETRERPSKSPTVSRSTELTDEACRKPHRHRDFVQPAEEHLRRVVQRLQRQHGLRRHRNVVNASLHAEVVVERQDAGAVALEISLADANTKTSVFVDDPASVPRRRRARDR